jgi:HK97 family phage prohead protease
MLQKLLNSKIKEVNEEENSIKFVFSTNEEDRHGEVVDQAGWNLKEFLKNPVVLFAHDHYQPAIGQVVNIGYENGQLEGEIKFAVDEYPFAKTIYQLYKGNFMRAVSAGFRNDKYEVDEENDRIVLKENTLYEMSVVNVPANTMALAKGIGIDTTPLEKMIKDKKIVLSKEDVKKLGENISNNIKETINKTGLANPTVETPKDKGKGVKRKLTTKQINTAIRKLLKRKSKLK